MEPPEPAPRDPFVDGGGTEAALRAEIAQLRAENARLRDELRRWRRDQHETPPHYL